MAVEITPSMLTYLPPLHASAALLQGYWRKCSHGLSSNHAVKLSTAFDFCETDRESSVFGNDGRVRAGR